MDNIIKLTDKYGNEVEFELLDIINLESEYVVLLPVEDQDEPGMVVILRVETENDSEEDAYISVESDDELQEVFNIFRDRHKDEFDFED